MKWRCTRCKTVRGKRNPQKAGWTTILLAGKSLPLCPACSKEMIEAARIYNESLLKWIASGVFAPKT